jgi:hypothetical protein
MSTKFVIRPTPLSDSKCVDAIKSIRAIAGIGLKEAKDLYDSMKISRQPLEIVANPSAWLTPTPTEEAMLRILRDNGHFEATLCQDVAAEQLSHKEHAEQHLRVLAKELLDSGKYESATNVANLLSLLSKVET